MKTKKSTQDTLSLLLSGKHSDAKKYTGKYVMVIEDKIFPLKKGKEALKDIDRLEKRYGKIPTLAFIPRRDISYILIVCR